MKMTVQDALNAAHDAETEGLLGKYPMAAQVLAQELNHELLGRVSRLARSAMTEDGEHHKQWYLAMILKEVDAKAHYDLEQWGIDMGIAP